MRSGFAEADGVELYYERRGQGPPLLMIVGGGGDCGVYGAIGDILATTYTVVTYDRRGNSRSLLRGPPARIEIADQSSDALAVLRANGFESARVFGSSGGATIALDIAARHPAFVEAVVPHEPPTPRILPDAASLLARYDDIDRVLQTEGWRAAFRLFLEVNQLVPPGEPVAVTALLDPESILGSGPLLDILKRQRGNWEYMMKYEVRPFVDYLPDLEGIASNQVRMALTAGVETRGQYFHRSSEVIAGRLEAEFVEFPGGHSGAMEVPGVFAANLRALFDRLEADGHPSSR